MVNKKSFGTMIVMAVMLFFAVGAEVYAQNIFYATKKGMVLTYENKDYGESVRPYRVETIIDVKGSGNNLTITYNRVYLDTNRKSRGGEPNTQTVDVKDGTVFIDTQKPFDEAGIKYSADLEEIPGTMRPGQKLKDWQFTMTLALGFIKQTQVAKHTNRECVAIEDIKVPAGTFTCYKVTATVTSTKFDGKTGVIKNITWYAPNIGIVKFESYDSNNKLRVSDILIELKGN
jgi:hypothetical protein